jgi:hypothetical protein
MNKTTTWTQAESPPPARISALREIVPGTEAPLAFKALLALTFVIYIAPQAIFPVLEPLRLALVSAVLAVGTYLLYVSTSGVRLSVMGPEVKLVLGIFALAVISIPMSKWPGGSFQFLIDQYYKSIVLFLLVANLLTSDKRFRQLLWAIAIFSAINGGLGLKAYFNGEFFAENRFKGGFSGIASNPNDLALTLNLALPFVWYLYKSSKSTFQRITAFGILCLSVITIVVTFSRGGFLTLMGLLLWVGLIKFKEHKPRVFLGGLLFLVAFMVLTPEGYSTRIISIVDTKQDKTGSADARWESMKTAAQIAVEHPLGTGLNMNNLAIQEAGMGWNGVHTVYLEIACDLGLLAGFLYVWLLWKLFVGMRHIRLSAGKGNVGSLAEATEGSLVAFAVAAMFHPVSYHFYFYYIAGIAVAVNEMARRESRSGVA